MARAFVLVDVTPGAAEELPELISGVDGVREARPVSGDHDAVVETEGTEVHDLFATVTEEIRPLDPVEGTETYVVLE